MPQLNLCQNAARGAALFLGSFLFLALLIRAASGNQNDPLVPILFIPKVRRARLSARNDVLKSVCLTA